MKKIKELIIRDIEVVNHPEFGYIFTFVCPDCYGVIRQHDYASFLDTLECECRKWTVTFKATGYLKEGD